MSGFGDKKQGNNRRHRELLQRIPKVDECIAWLLSSDSVKNVPLTIIKNSIREELSEIREAILGEQDFAVPFPDQEQILARLIDRIKKKQQNKFRRVINCTGVIIHTNLGRSILSQNTMERLQEIGSRYANLEFDLQTGKRGSRYSLVEELLCELTGAEAALVVNNNAAAVLIALETVAKGKEVIVSRGQLVEIGGAFRIPDVMARSGARLVEVGATNRTHVRDYENALNENTALLLKVHCSNYRIIGFTKEVPLEELIALGKRHNVPVMEDLGSGCFVDLSQFGLAKEPTVQEIVKTGTDIVTFSGDKLLGGPQAGVILGRREFIEKIKRNPLNRAVRIDKFTLAGLESILRIYFDPKKAIETIPTLAMISATPDILEKRAKRLIRMIRKELISVCDIELKTIISRVGGGAMPEQNLESRGVALRPQKMKISDLESGLRGLEVPIIGRIENDWLYLDMRTVADDELTLLAGELRQTLIGISA